MDFYSSYLTGINQIIGQNGRFARQFVADQETNASTGGTTTGNTGTTTTGTNGADSQTVTMIIMLFQLMAQMLGGVSTTGSNANATAATPTPAPYVPGLSTTGNNSTPISQNPAVISLEARIAQKTADNPDTTTAPEFSAEDVQAVQSDLQAGAFTSTDLGQALMYELDQAPTQNLQPISRLITDLTDSGDLNITPFLQNDYLTKLSPERQDALLSAVELSGLRMDNGKPNARLIGFMLDHLAKPGEPQSKAFIQTFLQDFYDAYGQEPDTPVGNILSQTLDLAGVTADADGNLQFESV